MLREIERQATMAWHDKSQRDRTDAYGLDQGKWKSAIAAWDFMTIDISGHEVDDDEWWREINVL